MDTTWEELGARRDDIDARSRVLNRRYDRALDGSAERRAVLADLAALSRDRLALESDEAALADDDGCGAGASRVAGVSEREPSYSADMRAIAEALDEAGAPRKIGTLSLNLVERVALLDGQLARSVKENRKLRALIDEAPGAQSVLLTGEEA
jgi:hypothetical protein